MSFYFKRAFQYFTGRKLITWQFLVQLCEDQKVQVQLDTWDRSCFLAQIWSEPLEWSTELVFEVGQFVCRCCGQHGSMNLGWSRSSWIRQRYSQKLGYLSHTPNSYAVPLYSFFLADFCSLPGNRSPFTSSRWLLTICWSRGELFKICMVLICSFDLEITCLAVIVGESSQPYPRARGTGNHVSAN